MAANIGGRVKIPKIEIAPMKFGPVDLSSTNPTIRESSASTSEITADGRLGKYANNRYSWNMPKPWSGAPNAPNMTQMVDPMTGKLKSQFQVGQGNNTWLQMMQNKNQMEMGNARDVASADAQNQYNAGVNRLGMTGGIDAGSRERLARQSQRSLLGNQQSIANTGAMTGANYNIEKARMDQDAERINTANAMGSINANDMWNQGLYTDTMKWQAADRMANAYGGGGGGGGGGTPWGLQQWDPSQRGSAWGRLDPSNPSNRGTVYGWFGMNN